MKTSESNLKRAWPKLDSLILIRMAATTLIVCGHFDVLHYGGGGAYTLMLLAGVTYARYIVPKLSNPALARETHALLVLKIAVPTIAYIILSQLLTQGKVDWRPLFLISNFFPPNAASYWFIEVYIQINLLLLWASRLAAGQSCLQKLQRFVPTLIFCIALAGVAAFSRAFWSTEHLFNRVPQQMAWLFAAGILFAACTTPLKRVAFLFVVALICQWLWTLAQTPPFFIAAVTLMVLLPGLPVRGFRFPAWLCEHVSKASLMVYLTHIQWGLLWKKLGGEMSSFTAVAVALLGGVILQSAYNVIWLRFKNQPRSR